MTDTPHAAQPRCGIWKEKARGVLRRLTAALFALTLAFLTSVVHVSHTCHESSLKPVVSNEPASHETVAGNSFQEGSAVSLCLACMFLQAIRTTLVTAVVFYLCCMAVLRWLRSFAPSLVPSGWVVSGFPIRAPPLFRQPDHP